METVTKIARSRAAPVMPDDVEFFVFLFGMWRQEIDYFEALLASFPYFSTHRLKVVDMSEAVRAAVQEDPTRLFIDPRSCVLDPEYTFPLDALEALLSDYAGRIDRIVEPAKLFHGPAIDRVLREHATRRFVVLMDSDIRFVRDSYLEEALALCGEGDPDEIAAVGMLYQKHPFYPTLKRGLDIGVYRHFLTAGDAGGLRQLMKLLVIQAYRRLRGGVARGRTSHLPRLHPALLMVNRDLFIAHGMSFHNLYLDVLEARPGRERRQKILGDNGASFLYQCAAAGKAIVNIDIARYVDHAYKGSRAGARFAGSLNWGHDTLSDFPPSRSVKDPTRSSLEEI